MICRFGIVKSGNVEYVNHTAPGEMCSCEMQFEKTKQNSKPITLHLTNVYYSLFSHE